MTEEDDYRVKVDSDSTKVSILEINYKDESTGNESYGRLFVGLNGKMEFEGDVEESARIFFDYMKKFIDDYITEKSKKAKEALRKYGRHLSSCELVKQPFSGRTDSYWSCTCGFSEALDCQLCEKKGYVVNLPVQNGYITGHCPECGNI